MSVEANQVLARLDDSTAGGVRARGGQLAAARNTLAETRPAPPGGAAHVDALGSCATETDLAGRSRRRGGGGRSAQGAPRDAGRGTGRLRAPPRPAAESRGPDHPRALHGRRRVEGRAARRDDLARVGRRRLHADRHRHIVDMASLEIEVDVNEAYINRVRRAAGDAVLDAYPEWHIPAHVIRHPDGRSREDDGACAHGVRPARSAHPAGHGREGGPSSRRAGGGPGGQRRRRADPGVGDAPRTAHDYVLVVNGDASNAAPCAWACLEGDSVELLSGVAPASASSSTSDGRSATAARRELTVPVLGIFVRAELNDGGVIGGNDARRETKRCRHWSRYRAQQGVSARRRAHRRAGRPQPRRPAGGLPRADGALGLGQVDAAQSDRRPRQADRRVDQGRPASASTRWRAAAARRWRARHIGFMFQSSTCCRC